MVILNPKELKKSFYIPKPDSHKGQNGKLLIIGGSSLFHAAPIWAAEVASHIVDIVHLSSTAENNKVFTSLKKVFRNGIVIPHRSIDEYVSEDDAILLGPGMVREGKEAKEAAILTKTLLLNFPKKKFVIDAGALQIMDPTWMVKRTEKVIITPHQREFEWVFKTSLANTTEEEKSKIVQETAKKYNCMILLKTVVDIVSDGETTWVSNGGNQGLTKGGTGDVLAGLCAALAAKNNQVTSALLASYFVKEAATELSKNKGYWYNTEDLIAKIPVIIKKFAL